MKKANKYNLLAKNEPKKEKLQEEWVQMESVSQWERKGNQINDTSYMKLEEEYSEIEHDHSERGARNANLMLSNNNNVAPQYNQSSKISSQQLPQPIKPSNVPQQLPINTVNNPRQAAQNLKSSYNPTIPQQRQSTFNSQQSTFNSQLPQNNSYDNNYYNNQQYAGQSALYSQGQRGSFNPNQSQSYQNSQMRNLQGNGGYQQYTQSQYNNFNQPVHNSAYQQPNHSMMNSRQPQQYINPNFHPSQTSQLNPQLNPKLNPQQSSLQPDRPAKRQSIPEMTVNCQKCTFTQSVPGNSQIYICCICNQINQCYPLYGVFTCGICRANVIYPNGTSRLIKCTKCQTVNRVNPQPSRKIDQVVTMGKEKVQLEEEIGGNNRQEEFVGKQEELKTQGKMSRNQQEIDVVDKDIHSQVKTNKNPKGPFQILPALKEKEIKQQKHSQNNNIPQITEDQKPQRRQPSQLHVEFNQELIQLDIQPKELPHFSTDQADQNLCKQLLELSEKLDQSLIISKEQKIQQSQQNKNEKQTQHYPSLFDF